MFHSNKKTKNVLWIVAASVCFFSTSALAFNEQKFQEAHKSFMEKGSEERAAAAFTELLQQEPGDSLLMVYAGSATAQLATTTRLPWKMMSYAEDGLAMIDKALQLAANTDASAMHGTTPVALEVKYVAASTFLAVPGFMNRGVRGQKLLSDVLENKQFEKTPIGFKGAVWIRAAKAALMKNQNGDAKRYLHYVIEQNAPQAEAAKAMLKGIAA